MQLKQIKLSRLITVLLLLLIVITLVFPIFIGIIHTDHHDHDSGKYNCGICEQIKAWINTIKKINVVLIVLLHLYIACEIVFFYSYLFLNYLEKKTLVQLKVVQNN